MSCCSNKFKGIIGDIVTILYSITFATLLDLLLHLSRDVATNFHPRLFKSKDKFKETQLITSEIHIGVK